MKAIIYHNPRCSKSRATLALLEKRKIDLEIIEYLRTPLSTETLQDLLDKLRLKPADIVRTSEPEFQASGMDQDAPDTDLLQLIVEHRNLLQRPIVVVGSQARIGRPPNRYWNCWTDRKAKAGDYSASLASVLRMNGTVKRRCSTSDARSRRSSQRHKTVISRSTLCNK